MSKFLLAVTIAAVCGVTCEAQASDRASKITPTPETQWGEWSQLETSTVEFPAEEFPFAGTVSDAATYYREAEGEEGHAQYRFDNVFASNVSDEKTSLYVDVYGDEVTVYSQALPQMDLGPDVSGYCPDHMLCVTTQWSTICRFIAHSTNTLPLRWK